MVKGILKEIRSKVFAYFFVLLVNWCLKLAFEQISGL